MKHNINLFTILIAFTVSTVHYSFASTTIPTGKDGKKSIHTLNNTSDRLFSVFVNRPHQNELDLSHNKLDNDDVKYLVELFEKLPHLQVLDLRFNNFNDASAKDLARALSKLPHLQVLDLSSNYLGDPDEKFEVSNLAKRSNIPMPSSDHLGTSVVQHLLPALERLPLLRKVDLSCNNLSNEQKIALWKALANRSIKLILQTANDRISKVFFGFPCN